MSRSLCWQPRSSAARRARVCARARARADRTSRQRHNVYYLWRASSKSSSLRDVVPPVRETQRAVQGKAQKNEPAKCEGHMCFIFVEIWREAGAGMRKEQEGMARKWRHGSAQAVLAPAWQR